MREQSSDAYSAFAAWLDLVLAQAIPTEVVAFVFNLYEGEDSFDVQLAGCPRFDKENDEWAAAHVFTTGENLFEIPRTWVRDDWCSALSVVKQIIARYLAEGDRAPKLTDAKAIAVGFVDGDLDIVRSVA